MKDQERISKEKELVKEEETDLLDLVKILWRDRRIIIKTVIIFTFLGLVVALFSKKEYAASTIMGPRISPPVGPLGGASS